MRKKIGRYDFGIRAVDVYVREGTGGSFVLGDYKERGIAEMVIGLDDTEWSDCVAILLHEAFEMAMTDMCCRWCPSPGYSGDHGAYLFTMKHEQFSEVAARCSVMVSGCLPALEAAYKKHKSRKQKQ